MKTKFAKLTIAGLLTVLGSTVAQADPVSIYSITMEVRTSTYVVSAADSVMGDLLPEFYNNGSAVCTVALNTINSVGSVNSCGGPNTNIATLFTIDFSQGASDTIWQLGADWGRGGGVYRIGEVTYAEDLWWNNSWSNSDVKTFSTFGGGILGLIGFEGCCEGGTSLRYSSDGGRSWTMASVNAVRVPEPSILALLGLGLLGIGLVSRRRI